MSSQQRNGSGSHGAVQVHDAQKKSYKDAVSSSHRHCDKSDDEVFDDNPLSHLQSRRWDHCHAALDDNDLTGKCTTSKEKKTKNKNIKKAFSLSSCRLPQHNHDNYSSGERAKTIAMSDFPSLSAVDDAFESDNGVEDNDESTTESPFQLLSCHCPYNFRPREALIATKSKTTDILPPLSTKVGGDISRVTCRD